MHYLEPSSNSAPTRWRVADHTTPVIRALTLVTMLVAALMAHAQTTEYVIGPRDVLAVSVANEPGLSGKFTVVDDGTVAYPLLGSVPVRGMSARAVERELTARLADGFLEKPVVSVTLEQVGSQRIVVAGEVKQAGSYPLAGPTTVLEALLLAGAPTQNAGSDVLIVRAPGKGPDGTERAVIKVNFEALQRGDLTQNVVLRADDMVFVPRVEEPPPVYVTGEVNRPGAYQLARGAVVLHAVAHAGGVTARGSKDRVTIVRVVKGEKVEVKASLTEPVQPGDTIVVGRRFF